MKIGIDARMFGKGFGLARYVEQLIIHLAQVDTENEYVLFVRSKEQLEEFSPLLGERQREVSATGDRDPLLTSPYQGEERFTHVIADIAWYSLAEQLHFKKIIKQARVDLMHFPHWNVPFFYNDPFVVTIHDLIMYHYPRPEATTLGPLKFWLKDQVHRRVVRHAVNKAKRILVTSEFTKQDVHKTLGVPEEKMTVTYQAPFTSSEPIVQSQEDVLKKYGISKPFAMYVGAAYPHKNLERLIEAWKKIVDVHGDAYQLVLVGKRNYFYERLRSSVFGLQSLIFTDFVPDEELSILYQHARLYVFPSLYEGFGLPPLEAMTHGVPVVSSDKTCLPEVLGEGALYFDPENADQMAKVIWRGLNDEELRRGLQEKAKQTLARYDWNQLAQDTKNTYVKAKNAYK